MEVEEIIKHLKKHSSARNKEGMARFGIDVKRALGVNIPILRSLAKKLGRDHDLARELWNTNIHEAMLLASMIEEIDRVTEKQINLWVKEFNSWDLCDQCCMNLFSKLPFAFLKAKKWAKEKREFTRRAGFALMAALAVHNKKAKDKDFISFFPLIKKYSIDERNFVKKAVNWALRQIGKRNKKLNKKAIILAKQIRKINSRSAKWIASNAIRELEQKTF